MGDLPHVKVRGRADLLGESNSISDEEWNQVLLQQRDLFYTDLSTVVFNEPDEPKDGSAVSPPSNPSKTPSGGQQTPFQIDFD